MASNRKIGGDANGESDYGDADRGDDSKMAGHEEENNHGRTFECNICLECARDPVLSDCGHMFCWPCLYRWFEERPQDPVCPVCNAAIGMDRVTPVYGGGGCDSDPRGEGIPPRPQGRRTEPRRSEIPGSNVADSDRGGLQLTMGIGTWPFNFLTPTLTLSLGEQRNEDGPYIRFNSGMPWDLL